VITSLKVDEEEEEGFAFGVERWFGGVWFRVEGIGFKVRGVGFRV